MAEGRILVVGADDVAGPSRAALDAEGYVVAAAASPAAALEEVERADWDDALVDLGLAEAQGHDLVRALRARRPGLVVVALALSGPRGVAAREAGAWTFLEKPGDLTREKLLTVVANAVEYRALNLKAAALERAVPATLKLEERERQAILQALETTKWNKQAAAVLLGLHRPTLYSKMRKHGIPQKRPS